MTNFHRILLLLIAIILWPGMTALNGGEEVAFSPEEDYEDYEMYDLSDEGERYMKNMTLEEKIGQLFMVAAYSDRHESHFRELEELVEEYHIGGVLFFQGGPERQVELYNRLQEEAETPLLTAIDGEWGLGMRLDSTISFPYKMALGAIENDSLIYEMGREIGRQLKATGVHVNFAPVVDVNNNSANPVIGMRSFGEDLSSVSSKNIAYLRGLQDEGVMAVAKHFPGHGDTDADSHYELPVIDHDRERLEELELVPFRNAFDAGVGGVMSAHLHMTAFEEAEDLPSSLSPRITQELLQEDLGFEGLVFTDALNMDAVSDYYEADRAALEAFKAGNDVLLFPEDVPGAFKEIKKAIEQGDLSEERLDRSVRKILAVKEWTNEDFPSDYLKPAAKDTLVDYLNRPEARIFNRELVEKSITFLHNEADVLPIRDLRNKEVALVSLGTDKKTTFEKLVERHWPVTVVRLPEHPDSESIKEMAGELLQGYDLVIQAFHGLPSFGPNANKLPERERFLSKAIDHGFPSVKVLFGSPYVARDFELQTPTVLGWQDDSLFQQAAAEAIFGVNPVSGRLPVNITPYAHIGEGYNTTGGLRLRHGLPEETGIDSRDLAKIDEVVKDAIENRGTPGAQVFVAHQGNVIYDKAFGRHTYEDTSKEVEPTDLYDVASVTKIAATTLAAMRFYETGRLSLNDMLSHYLPGLDNEDKRNIKLRELMTHQSGLASWIPFYQMALEEEGLDDFVFCYERGDHFNLQVADGLFASEEIVPEMIWDTILTSPVNDKGEYQYSDLSMFYLKRALDELMRKPFETFLHEEFYHPLGLSTMGFNPTVRFPLDRIVPTEMDRDFRGQLVHGHVHDPAAAMMGGVAGNAGLFSNAYDVGVIMQMLLNRGEYGGNRYFSSSTIDKFTSTVYEGNRRGLGFDKPETDPDENSPAPDQASPRAFGHLGFTGASVWADPEYDLVFVFLSNRVHPDTSNSYFSSEKVRTQAFEAVYEAIGAEEKR